MSNIDPKIQEIMKECYPFIEEYNPAQQAVIDSDYIEKKDNFIISIPTASGKTAASIYLAKKYKFRI